MLKNHRLTLIADDFTGALDTGVQFLTPGRAPRLTIWPEVTLPEAVGDSPEERRIQEFLIVDTESRFLEPADAAGRVAAVTRELLEKGYEPFFKKIDSTFRGNVGAELTAMLDLLPYPAVAVVAAVPLNGRTVEGGRVFVNGVPVGESESGRDPFTPNRSSTIREILQTQTTKRIDEITLRDIKRGGETLTRRIERSLREGAELLIFDGKSQSDLATLGTALGALDSPLLLAGTSGLARALVSTEGKEAGGGIGTLGSSGRVLIVVGSLMPTTVTQADRLSKTEPVATAVIDTKGALSGPESELRRLLELARRGIDMKPHLLLRTSDFGPSQAPFRDAGSVGTSEAVAVAEFVGRLCRELTETQAFDTLVLTGGSTALAVVRALEISSLQVVGEVLDGVPLSVGRSNLTGRRYRIITKAGGFGGPDALAQIVEKG
ncbi:MAG: four-carbon acid sugar kinase family protein [Alkalispirochaetaceae bacterium]